MRFSKLALAILICLCLTFFVVAQNSSSGTNVTEEIVQEESSVENTTENPPPETNETPSEEGLSILPIEEDNATQDNQTQNLVEENNSTNETIAEENITQPSTNNETTPPPETADEPANTEPDAAEEEPSLLSTILEIILEKISFLRGEVVEFEAQLSHQNTSPIPDQQVDFYFDAEKIGTETTDESGLATFLLNTSPFPAGSYTVKTQYGGNEVLKESTDLTEITIEEVIAENTTVIQVENQTVEETLEVTSETIQVLEDCQEITWEEEEPVYDICTPEIVTTVCDDEPANTSCSSTVSQQNYSCLVDMRIVQKSRQECVTTGYQINNVKLDTTDYGCSTEENGNEIIVTCDSKYDGNGDGICHSGESCQKFVINGDSVDEYEKNSEDDFMESDDSYFLQKASAEVVE